MVLGDALAHRQANPGASNFGMAVQTLEKGKDPVVIVRGDANAVVPKRQQEHFAIGVGIATNSDLWWRVRSGKFDRVVDHVLKEGDQLHRMTGNRWQITNIDNRVGTKDVRMQVADCGLRHLIQINGFEQFLFPDDPRVIKDIFDQALVWVPNMRIALP